MKMAYWHGKKVSNDGQKLRNRQTPKICEIEYDENIVYIGIGCV